MRNFYHSTIKRYLTIIASLLLLALSTHSSAHPLGCLDDSVDETSPLVTDSRTSIGTWLYTCMELDQQCCPENGAPRYVIFATIGTLIVGGIVLSALIYFLTPKNSTVDNDSTSTEKYTRSNFIINDAKDFQIQCPNGESSVGAVQETKIEPNYQVILNKSARNQLDSATSDDPPEFINSFLQLNQALCEGYHEPEALNDCSARVLAGLRGMKLNDITSLLDYTQILVNQLKNKAIFSHAVPAFLMSELGLSDGRSGYITVSGHVCPSEKE